MLRICLSDPLPTGSIISTPIFQPQFFFFQVLAPGLYVYRGERWENCHCDPLPTGQYMELWSKGKISERMSCEELAIFFLNLSYMAHIRRNHWIYWMLLKIANTIISFEVPVLIRFEVTGSLGWRTSLLGLFNPKLQPWTFQSQTFQPTFQPWG